MRFSLTFLALGLCVMTARGAGPINRCESSDGRVVYSDEPCPSGTQRMRTVDEKPAVEVSKKPADEHAHDARSAGSVRRAPQATAGVTDGDRDREAASELRQLKLAECDDLVRRVEYAQHDLSAAAEGERTSAELSLRRLQADNEEKCGKNR
jgi:hypothetical protein